MSLHAGRALDGATPLTGRGTAPTPETIEVVTFRLSGEVLAVATRHLREVIEPVQLTRVPGAPRFVGGLFNNRGSVVPLADLRVPLRMPIHPPGDDARIMVLELEIEGRPCVVGIHADRVHEVTRLEVSALEAVPPVGARWPPKLVTAVGRWNRHFVTVPDLTAILAEFLADPHAPHAASSPQD